MLVQRRLDTIQNMRTRTYSKSNNVLGQMAKAFQESGGLLEGKAKANRLTMGPLHREAKKQPAQASLRHTISQQISAQRMRTVQNMLNPSQQNKTRLNKKEKDVIWEYIKAVKESR